MKPSLKPAVERKIIDGLEKFAAALEDGQEIAKQFTCPRGDPGTEASSLNVVTPLPSSLDSK